MNNLVKINVVIPVYNPSIEWENRILTSCNFIKSAAPLYDWHFHLVNDGSKNVKLFELLRHLQLDFLHFHEYSQNKGKGYAVRYGFQEAKEADLFMYTDFDFPFGEAVLIDAITRLEFCDILIANRGQNYYAHIPKFRQMLTKIQRIINLYFLQLDQYDTQGGFKAFNHRGLFCLMQTSINQFLFDSEFISIAQNIKSLKIKSIEVRCRENITLTNFKFTLLLKEICNLPKIILARYVKKYTLNSDDRLRRI